MVVSWPLSRRSTLSKEILSPVLYSRSFIFSIESTLPEETLYCLPPVWITANSSLAISVYPIVNLTKKQLCSIIFRMQTKIIERYFFFGLLLATFIFTFLIFLPFWVVLVLGISFSIVLYPIYKWLEGRKIPSTLSALLTVLLFTIVLCGPLLGIGAMIFNQSEGVYNFII